MTDTTYADGTYGASTAGASSDYETDQHEVFKDQQARVLALAAEAGPSGITGQDVRAATGWGDSSKSRALSNLLRDRKLIRLVDRRDRAHIHVLPEYAGNRVEEPYRSISEKHHAAGFQEGADKGFLDGLMHAFRIAEEADNIGDVLIALRSLIGSSS